MDVSLVTTFLGFLHHTDTTLIQKTCSLLVWGTTPIPYFKELQQFKLIFLQLFYRTSKDSPCDPFNVLKSLYMIAASCINYKLYGHPSVWSNHFCTLSTRKLHSQVRQTPKNSFKLFWSWWIRVFDLEIFLLLIVTREYTFAAHLRQRHHRRSINTRYFTLQAEYGIPVVVKSNYSRIGGIYNNR